MLLNFELSWFALILAAGSTRKTQILSRTRIVAAGVEGKMRGVWVLTDSKILIPKEVHVQTYVNVSVHSKVNSNKQERSSENERMYVHGTPMTVSSRQVATGHGPILRRRDDPKARLVPASIEKNRVLHFTAGASTAGSPIPHPRESLTTSSSRIALL